MKWLDRLLRGRANPDIAKIRQALSVERVRHDESLREMHDALEDYERTRRIADHESRT